MWKSWSVGSDRNETASNLEERIGRRRAARLLRWHVSRRAMQQRNEVSPEVACGVARGDLPLSGELLLSTVSCAPSNMARRFLTWLMLTVCARRRPSCDDGFDRFKYEWIRM